MGRKFTIFVLFYFVFEGKFQVQAPGGLIFGGALLRRLFCVTILGGLYLEGLVHGEAYFSEFYGIMRALIDKRWKSFLVFYFPLMKGFL